MDSLGNDFLARPGCPTDKYGDVTVRYCFCKLQEFNHLFAAIQDVSRKAVTCFAVFGDAQYLPDLTHQLSLVNGFGQKCRTAKMGGLDGILDLCLTTQHDYGKQGIIGMNCRE